MSAVLQVQSRRVIPVVVSHFAVDSINPRWINTTQARCYRQLCLAPIIIGEASTCLALSMQELPSEVCPAVLCR
jgi:hypothetical protein